MKRRHRIRRSLVLGGIVGAILLSGLLFFPATVTRHFEMREVIVPKGASIEEISKLLEQKDLVGNPRLFVLAARVLGYDRGLKAGRFSIPVGSSIYRILRQLARGMSSQDMVTIPEGLRADQIAQHLYERAKIDPIGLMTLAGDSTFTRSLGVPADRIEGYLYPDTYPFYPLLTPAEVLRVMAERALRIFGEEMALPGARQGLTLHQLVTLASIVEAEAQVPSERVRIAAVFYNRLRQGMMLQSDPTVLYALGVWRGRTYYRDLDVKSPYNTYRNRGLPPGPICNPGKDAVHAVLFPLADSTEYYFVARGDGTHIFSRTWEEHLKAIAHVRAQAKRESTLVPTGPGVTAGIPTIGSTALPGAPTDVPTLRAAPAPATKDSVGIGPPPPPKKATATKAATIKTTATRTPTAKAPATKTTTTKTTATKTPVKKTPTKTTTPVKKAATKAGSP